MSSQSLSQHCFHAPGLRSRFQGAYYDFAFWNISFEFLCANVAFDLSGISDRAKSNIQGQKVLMCKITWCV